MGRLNLTSSLCLSPCSTSQCIPITHCGFECCALTRVVLMHCGARLKIFPRSHADPLVHFTFLSHTDKFFTPHQRRLLPAEQHLSALSSLLSISPSLSDFAFLPSSCFHPHIILNCLPSLVQNPRNFLRCVKNKTPFLLCKLYLFTLSFLSFFFFNFFLFSSGFNKTRKP